MIVLTSRAARQVRALREHYEKLGRPVATRNLIAAFETAGHQIITDPAAGVPTPRPYPNVAKRGQAWVLAGRY